MSIQFNRGTFAWPDGDVQLADLTLTLPAGRTGIVGDNGAGKTTFARLITGELAPTSGTVDVPADVGVLPQDITLDPDADLADLLGVAGKLAALAAIESGDVAEEHFDALGDDWDIAERTRAELDAVGLGRLELDRPVRRMSGGEVVLAALVGLHLRRHAVVVLDEPTNNLDRDTRGRLYDLVQRWSGTVLVVSHDPALLRRMDAIAEVRDGGVRLYGGGFDAWRDAVAVEQAAAERAVRTAEGTLRVERRQAIETETRLARRERTGRGRRAEGQSKAAADFYRNRAEKTTGRLRDQASAKVADARAAVEAAEERLRDEEAVHVDLPDPGVGVGRRLAAFVVDAGTPDSATHEVVGPERVALLGPNGVGKSRLIAALLGADVGGRVSARLLTDRVGHLPQRLDHLADDDTVLAAVQGGAPDVPEGVLRDRLARFHLRRDDVFRPVGSLSGGERFRVALARLLLAEPPAQLLVLDEPTNNLDLRTVGVLVDALASYRGGLLVVSHDDAFRDQLGIERTLVLDADGGLAEVTRPGTGEGPLDV